MRWLTILAVVVVSALMSPTAASGYTFGDWANAQGYPPLAVMPDTVDTRSSSPAIDSLDGIGDYDWTSTPTTRLHLLSNQISSIEAGDFSGLTNLMRLNLMLNDISSIEAGDFHGLANLTNLYLGYNQISSIESGDFHRLTNLTELYLDRNQISSIESGDFDGLTNLEGLHLQDNQISSIESGDFSGLTNLTVLELHDNQISSIESDDFDGLTNLQSLPLNDNQISSIESGAFSGLAKMDRFSLSNNTALTELNLAEADFSSLDDFHLQGSVNITSVSLNSAVVNQTSLAVLLNGRSTRDTGIGEIDGITEMDLSGIDFVNITDLVPLYVMDDLTDLWLASTVNLDASALDVLLDNLATIEGIETEGILHMTQADYDSFNTAGGGLLAAWNLESGHHVAFVIPEPSSLLLGAMAAVGLLVRRSVIGRVKTDR